MHWSPVFFNVGRSKKLRHGVIEAERALDAIFKHEIVHARNLKETTQKAAEAHAGLRESHLRHHLLTIEVLSKQQIEQYNGLRGH